MSADVLRDLALAKAAFQLRAIEAIIHGPATATEAEAAMAEHFAENANCSDSVHEGAGRKASPDGTLEQEGRG